MTNPILKRAISKARSSSCRFKICAIGFDKSGNIVAYKSNSPREKTRSMHAEMAIMTRYGKIIKTILIIRTNKSGDLLPIDPCKMCQKKADELGILIRSIS